MSLHKEIVKYNFLKEHMVIGNLKILDGLQFYQFILKKGYVIEAKKFLKHGITGANFTALMAEKDHLTLKNKYKFSEAQIDNLKQFYTYVFRLRKIISWDFNSEEIPAGII